MTAVAADRDERSTAHRYSLFGLTVVSDVAFTAAAAGDDGQRPVTRVASTSVAELEAQWPRSPRRLHERRTYEGETVSFAGRCDDSDRYVLWLKGFGRYLVTGDGREILYATGDADADYRERYLIAQALPLAAALQGLEVLHAGGLAFGPAAVGFMAASGTGKTTLITRLAGSGATFLTDDVLALETTTGRVRAHPGAGFASIDAADLAAVASGTGVAGESDKRHVVFDQAAGPLPLAALYFIERDPSATVPRFEAVDPLDPRLVIANCFVPWLATPSRMIRQLDVCARLAADTQLIRLVVPEVRSLDALDRTVAAVAEDARQRCRES